MSLALADGAFENNLKTPENIYDLEIPPERESVRIPWKEDWLDKPIFRDIEKTADGTRISPQKALPYSKYRDFFVRLGRVTGFEDVLEPYQLRRGSGLKINSKTSPFLQVLTLC